MSGRGLLGRLDLPLSGGTSSTAHVGARQSKARGSGLDVVATRPYIPGDDPRTIDWPATARTGELHSRVTLALRARRVHIVLGGGGRMGFGPSRSKWATATDAARVLADIAHLGQDLMTLHTAHDSVAYHAPGRRLHDQLAFISSLSLHPPKEAQDGDISQSVNHLVHQSRYKGSIIAISDSFPSERDINSIVVASHRHAAAYVEVYDPVEWELPDAGRVRLRGPALNGRVLESCLSDATLRQGYKDKVQSYRSLWQGKLAQSGVPVLTIATSDHVWHSLARQLPRRR